MLQTKTVLGQQPNVSTDTMCLPIADVSNLVKNRDIAVQQRNALVERVNKLQEDNFNFRKAIEQGEGQINSLNKEDSITLRIVQSLKADAKTYSDLIAVNNKEISELKKQLKRQKRKTTATAIGGLAVAGTLIYLYITK